LQLFLQVYLLSNHGFVNAYLLVGDKLALMDTGMARAGAQDAQDNEL
jgi:flavorubredoxin